MPRSDWLAMLSPEFDGDFTDNFNNNSELCRQQKSSRSCFLRLKSGLADICHQRLAVGSNIFNGQYRHLMLGTKLDDFR